MPFFSFLYYCKVQIFFYFSAKNTRIKLFFLSTQNTSNMKRVFHITQLVLTLILFVHTQLIDAQNLVMNPSFEITLSNCSNFGGEGFTTDLINWDDANSGGDSCSSPDLFSACNLFATNMPGSILGYQYSRTGTRHAGFITHEALDEYREYIEGKTSSPLVAGQTYCVSFYISLANDVAYATNNIGVRFYNTLFQRNACPGQTNSLINVTPHLNYSCAAITDTTNWVRLQWDYIATGGEQFFVIGNFFDNANTIINNSGGSIMNPYAYYYVDDVSITPNSCCYADIESVDPVCINDSPFALNSTTGIGTICSPSITGTWSGNGVNTSSGVFSPNIAGVGTHIITFTATCGYVATTTIIVSPCVALSACVETNGTITVSNGVNPYNWEVYTPASSTPITNQTECTACGGTWTPFVNICLVGSMAVTSCNTPASWTNFATGTNSGTLPGTFPIQVTDAGATTLTINSLASLPPCSGCPPLTATSVSIVNVNCFGQSTGSFSVSTTGGASPYDYVLMNGATTVATFNNVAGSQVFSSLPAGTYTLNVLDNSGCPGTTTITITQPASPLTVAISGSTPATCGSSNGSATALGSGGTGTITYSWSPSGGSAATASGLAAGPYTVTATDTKGCTSSTPVTITSSGGATIAITSQTNVLCFGASTGSATATASSGSSPYDYVWANTAGTLQTTNNITGPNTMSGLAAGTYTVTVTDNNSCVSSFTVVITQPSSAVSVAITASTNATCGSANGSATALASNGTSGYTYSWAPSGGSAATANNLSANTYTVTATDGNGCTAITTAVIGSSGGPAVSLVTQVNISCNGASTGSATVSGTGGTGTLTYSWSGGAGSTATATSLSAGTYTVTVTDASSCSNTLPVIITQPNAITASVTTSPSNCGSSDGSATVTATGGTGSLTYLWSAPGGSSATLNNISNGTYTVTVTDANSCVQTATGVVGSIGGPTANAGSNATVVAGTSTVLNGTGTTGATYSWNPSSTLTNANTLTPTASPLQTTTYTLTVTQNGCSAKDSVTVFVEMPCGEIFVPTAFSPNGGDATENEVLKVYGNCILNLEFAIFDRWGEKVFETTNPAIGWDGTYKGKKLDTAVFVYFLKATVDGIDVKKQGNITLVK